MYCTCVHIQYIYTAWYIYSTSTLLGTCIMYVHVLYIYRASTLLAVGIIRTVRILSLTCTHIQLEKTKAM